MIAMGLLWLGASVPVGLTVGRVIRAGNVDRAKRAARVPSPGAAKGLSCAGCKYDDRTSGPINLCDLRPMQMCRLRVPRLRSDAGCDHYEGTTP